MRYDKNLKVFLGHSDWYTTELGIGYIPTEKAPAEARRAMKEYNGYAFKQKRCQIAERDFDNLIARVRKGKKVKCLCCGKGIYITNGNLERAHSFRCNRCGDSFNSTTSLPIIE